MEFKAFWKEHLGLAAVVILGLLLVVAFFSAPHAHSMESIFNDYDFVHQSGILTPITIAMCLNFMIIGGALYVNGLSLRMVVCAAGITITNALIYVIGFLWFQHRYPLIEHELVLLMRQCFLYLLIGIASSILYHIFIHYIIENKKKG